MEYYANNLYPEIKIFLIAVDTGEMLSVRTMNCHGSVIH